MLPSLLIDKKTGTKYENQTELKKYNPDLWEKNFGEGSEWYKLNKPKREAEKLLRDKEKEMKDKKYNYRKRKDGFGSNKFGDSKRSGKRSKGFGSKKFGAD